MEKPQQELKGTRLENCKCKDLSTFAVQCHQHSKALISEYNDGVVNVWLPCPCHVVAPAILQSLIVPLCSPRGCCVVLAVSECNTAKCSFSAVCPPWEAFDQLRCCVCFRVSLLACSAPWLSGILSELKPGFLQMCLIEFAGEYTTDGFRKTCFKRKVSTTHCFCLFQGFFNLNV